MQGFAALCQNGLQRQAGGRDSSFATRIRGQLLACGETLLNRFSADRGIHGSRGYPLCLQVTLLAKTGSGYHPQRAVSYVARYSLRVVAATSLSEQ